MQEPINQTQGETPSSTSGSAFVAGAALVGGVALLAATPKVARAVTPAIKYTDIPGAGDFKVLNYALALEALEADLYVQALQRLTTGGTNALGQTITGLNVSSSDAFAVYLQRFGKVEREHRDFLNTALGQNSILLSALRGAKFDFGINTFSAETLLDLLIDVENTGVQAYLGAIPQFSVRSQFLPTAAAIQGTEARHTAALIVIRNRKYPNKVVPANPLINVRNPAPLYTENNGIDGRLNNIPVTDPTFQQKILDKVSPFIVLGS